jgi:RecA-family ATPase
LSESSLPTTTTGVKPLFPDPIPGVIPFGSLCLFAAAAGAGKTIFQTEWIGRWLTGRPICGKKTNCPTGFYYLAADRDWSTYAQAFQCAGVPEDKIVKYVLAEDSKQNPLDWGKESPLNFLHRCIEILKPIPGSILFIDPMAPLFVLGDQNRARDVAISMHFIRRMARQYNITIICNANVVKAKTDTEHKRPQDRIVGSGAFIAYTDTQIYLVEGEGPDDPRTLGWTPRRGRAEEWQFEFDQETKLFVPFTGLQDNGPTEETDRPSQLLKLIPDEGIDRGDLEELAMATFNVSRATVGRDILKLKQNRLIIWDARGHISRRKPS